MENFVGLFMGILYGYFLADQWAKNKLKRIQNLRNIEVLDAEVVEAETEEINTVYFICDFSKVEKCVEVHFNTVSHDRN